MKMIDQSEVPDYLGAVIPEISSECHNPVNNRNIYRSIHVFLDYTFTKIRLRDLLSVKECFALAEHLYLLGSREVKCAIENVFVFSFSHFPASDPEESKAIMKMIPPSLHSIYMNQVLHHGV